MEGNENAPLVLNLHGAKVTISGKSMVMTDVLEDGGKPTLIYDGDKLTISVEGRATSYYSLETGLVAASIKVQALYEHPDGNIIIFRGDIVDPGGSISQTIDLSYKEGGVITIDIYQVYKGKQLNYLVNFSHPTHKVKGEGDESA